MPKRLTLVLVVAAPPAVGLVAPRGAWSSHWYMPTKAVQPARIGRISMVDNAVLERERTHARPRTYVHVHVGSAHGSEDSRAFSDRARWNVLDPTISSKFQCRPP